ncbi:MAG: PqqD family protein [Bacteroidales bacterium]|jgi:hypothetical protein|nr:PqqD family protein [Bacteroidales bacterium]
MKLKEGFVLRRICGKDVLFNEGTDQVDMSRLLSLNETASYLWNSVAGKEFDAGYLADLLVGKYNVDKDTALKDAENLCSRWLESGIAE